MKKKIALVRLRRGILDPLMNENKIMSFICDLDDVQKNDFVVVEVSQKTLSKNVENDFRVGQIIDFMVFCDGETAQFRPNNFIVFKIYNKNFLNRSYILLKKKWSLWARYRAIENKDNEKPRYSIFDDIIQNNDNLQFQRLTSWMDSLKPDQEHTDLEEETRIASIKMQRGILGKENNKPFNFICDLKDVKVGDYVIVEINRKNLKSKRVNDFRIGRIDSLLTWNDQLVSKNKPSSFVVWKLENQNFNERCLEVKKQKKELWEMYNLDKGRPDKKPDGIPMNLFDRLIDPNGTLHLDRLPKYQNKKTIPKKVNPINNSKKNSNKK